MNIQIVIPARGGSKRFPGKNIHLLQGKPLINYSIEYAIKEGFANNIWVNTDDKEIEAIAKYAGARITNRPPELAGDLISSVEVLKFQFDYFQLHNIECDIVVLLQPTNPLRPKNLLKKAIETFRSNTNKSLATFSPLNKKFGVIQKGKFVPRNYAPGERMQDLENLFFENGLLYITEKDSILRSEIITDDVYPLILDSWETMVDIDEPKDILLAEFLLSTKKKQLYMKPHIEISGRKIGQAYPPLVIAEIGINHEGSLTTAKEMVDAAYRAGAEVVKHQTHVVEDEMTAAAKKVIPGNADISIYEIMERCALDEKDENELKEYVEEKGMIFISTPFSRAAADRLQRMRVNAFKIGSGECNNFPLLSHIAQFGKPTILSTGMNSLETVEKAVAIFDKFNTPVALLHTTNLYPTPPNLVRYGAMLELHKAFPEKVFGLSDHTVNNNACLGAVALGASILERHFTDLISRKGPDILCSMDEEQCKALIEGSREIAMMRGGKKEPAAEEKVTSDFAFATACTINAVKEGEVFTTDNLWVKRPGTGDFTAEEYNFLIGKRASRNLPADIQLEKKDVII